jgi:hypothetical protein
MDSSKVGGGDISPSLSVFSSFSSSNSFSKSSVSLISSLSWSLSLLLAGLVLTEFLFIDKEVAACDPGKEFGSAKYEKKIIINYYYYKKRINYDRLCETISTDSTILRISSSHHVFYVLLYIDKVLGYTPSGYCGYWDNYVFVFCHPPPKMAVQ